MNENEFTRKVIGLAESYGLLVHHCYRSELCDGAGLPDLIIAGPLGVIFAELKTATGQTDDAQDAWAKLLKSQESWTEPVYFLWRPDDWVNGRIERIVKQLI